MKVQVCTSALQHISGERAENAGIWLAQYLAMRAHLFGGLKSTALYPAGDNARSVTPASDIDRYTTHSSESVDNIVISAPATAAAVSNV